MMEDLFNLTLMKGIWVYELRRLISGREKGGKLAKT
jgi:hypothetical protein